MTQATRDKLNLPPPNKNKNRSKFGSQQATSSDPSQLFTIDRNPDAPGEDDVGVKLAIDEFMSSKDTIEAKKEESPVIESKDATEKSKTKKKSSKKKKKRFKNLQ
mmetsp:Transcript_6770/g.16260  ORF Transcript_6770/g.16260 Transcript_6770/m.16260 type:complete len:105 (+) Transcript_6770:317-631(+)